jgi:hypothetical protein
MRRGPRIVARGKALAVSAIYGREGRGRDGELLAWRSQDGGKTWQGPATVNDVPGAAREGLHAMAAAPDGTLACVWLDMRGRGTTLYGSFSRDGGATWSRNQLVYRSPDGTICECCHPSAAYDRSGRLHVMWRNALGGARDMYLSTSSDGGKTFSPARKLGKGTWPLDACPMDGGALAVSSGRLGHDLLAARAARCSCALPASRSGGSAAASRAGPPGPPAVLRLAWLRRRNGALLALPPGARSSDAPVVLAREADDPVVASSPSGTGPVIVVWQDGKGANAGIRCAVLAQGKPVVQVR